MCNGTDQIFILGRFKDHPCDLTQVNENVLIYIIDGQWLNREV